LVSIEAWPVWVNMFKKAVLFLLGLFFAALPLFGQRKCGFDVLKAAIIAQNPGFRETFEQKQEELKNIARAYEQSKFGRKSGATFSGARVTVPVIFHIVADESQYNQLGGLWGIQQRVNSQIEVLNQDFNRQNPDSVLIPYHWKPFYADVGIRFGLAHTDPYGYPSPGFDVRIISNYGIGGSGSSYDSAKHTNLGGLDAWDVKKYINVWCLNFTDLDGLLGLTLPRTLQKSEAQATSDLGICILYNTLGKRLSDTDHFPKNRVDGNYFDMGRTLTHEMGHYFEIWHVWGDDGGSCPWLFSSGCDSAGGKFVLSDLPPQGDHTFGNPDYYIDGGTFYDNCGDSCTHPMQPIGIASLDYLDYTDDQGMHLFTPDQAVIMHSQVDSGGESYSLTLNPELMQYPVGAPSDVYVFPNPTSDLVTIGWENAKSALRQVVVFNRIGLRTKVIDIHTDSTDDHVVISLKGLNNGIYIFQCIFADKVITQKIVLYNN